MLSHSRPAIGRRAASVSPPPSLPHQQRHNRYRCLGKEKLRAHLLRRAKRCEWRFRWLHFRGAGGSVFFFFLSCVCVRNMSAALVSSLHHDFRDVFKQGLQSHRATTDLRQQMSLALERQLSQVVTPFTASSLINIPVATQGSNVPCMNSISNFQVQKSLVKQHHPLTASNSVASCNVATHIKPVSKEHRKLDRSASEPVDRSQQRQVQPNSSRYKTELCRPFEENGTCKYGDKCQFAHGAGELRNLARHPKYKTEPCRTFHSSGFCPYGPRCHFIHNSEDVKKCLLSTLQTTNDSNHGCSHPSSPTSRLSVAHSAPKDLDICGFSLGSAGDLSPTSSTSSGGSPASSLGGFFHDEGYQMHKVPQTAPPVMGNGFFFGPDCRALKPLSSIPALIPQQQQFFPQQQLPQECTTDDNFVSTLQMLVSYPEAVSKPQSPSRSDSEADTDFSRNVIRLPIFSRIAHGQV